MTKKTLAIAMAATLGGAGALTPSATAQGLLRRNGGSPLLNRAAERQAARQALRPAMQGAGQGAQPQKTSDPGASNIDPGGRSIEFNGAAIDIVLMVYGNLVGKTVLKDPSVPAAAITLQPKQGQELSDEDKILAIETVLEMNGVHLEPYGEKFVRALPRGSVRKDGIPLLMDSEAELGESTKVVSMMLTFRNIALDEAQKALEGLKSDKGVLNVYERTSSILVTDTEMNINRMREVANMIDVPTPVTENVFVRQIKNAAAQDIKTALEAIVQDSQKELEKQGRQANTAQQSRPVPTPTRSLLGRPGQQQHQAPTVNESLVTSVSDADRGMIRGKVLILSDERSNKLVIVTSKSNMDFFDKVIEQLDVETTPEISVKVYRLKYAEAEDVADMINDLIGNASSSKSSSRGNQNQNAKQGTGGNVTRSTAQPAAARKPANQRTGEAKTGELSKENTTVLADKRINGLVVMTNKELVPTIEQIIESMDIKLSQVLIETAIIEVTLGDNLKTGIDWVQRGRQGGVRQMTDSMGHALYYLKDADGKLTSSYGWQADSDAYPDGYELSNVPVLSAFMQRDGFVNHGNYALGGGGGTASGMLQTMMNVGTNATAAFFGGANPIGSGINYLLKSDKLNIAAVIQASKDDSRAKYIASPIVMTVDNKEATIDATENRQFVTGWTAQSGSYGNSGQPTPNYSSKDIGIKLKITPKINPNGTVMLNVEEEYTQFVENGQSMLIPQGGMYVPGKVDLAVERKMAADVLLEDRQTVVLGGLTETSVAESETGIPILKDIPWIGKWLFGSVSKSESRKELLIFLTPYILDDAEAAQAEALRRKRSLSDTRPWDDHGWSASALADPVARKEMLRRLKDEAAKQDDERKTKIAIEKWKVDRAKKLQEMSEEERDMWLKMYKEDLDKKDRKELERKMEDGESQDELAKLAEEVRSRKVGEAEKAMEKASDEARSENEHGRLEAEKAKKEVEEKK